MTFDEPHTAASQPPADFDEVIDRRGTHCVKWDMLQPLYGLSPDDGLAMWVADMDFRPPLCVQRKVEEVVAHGVYGYFGDDTPYRDAIRWWMQTRHGWQVARDRIFTTHGLGHGTAMCLDAFTAPGSGVVLMTPVYHAFARIIRAAGRRVVECPMSVVDGRHIVDIAAMDAAMTGGERMLILCSPHNPGGRVWSLAELRAIADFCRRHDLILVSDEIHHDLTYPGQHHTPMPLAAPEVQERLVMMTATSKTFNLAGAHTGNVIIADDALHARFAARIAAHAISPNSFGLHMATAAYSPGGAVWVDALMTYLDGNRRLFDEGLNAIPGVRSMPLEATYLAWVDFSDTGMSMVEFTDRVQKVARIAVNPGISFGAGGEASLRFNLGMPRARIAEAVARLQEAFSDLQ